MTILFSEIVGLAGSHARSNASVIIAARHCFPDAKLVLYATETHFQHMKECVDPEYQSVLDSIVFEPLTLRLRSSVEPKSRFLKTWNIVLLYVQAATLLWKTGRLCRKHGCDFTVYLSGPGYHIRFAKWFSFLSPRSRPMVFIVHNWKNIHHRWVRRMLFPTSWSATRLRAKVPCRYVLQHGGMRSYLEEEHNEVLSSDFVELWRAIVFGSQSKGRSASPERIDIDFLSPSHKGVDIFCEYVAACNERLAHIETSRRVSFGVIGGFTRSVHQQVIENLKRVSISRYPTDYLTNEEYAENLLRTTFIVHLFDPDLFECRFSSAIQDGIAWRLPAIFLRNNYTKHIFEDLGTPGVQAATLDEAVDLTITMVRNFDDMTYESQVRDVETVRKAYSVENVASQFRRAVAGLVEPARPKTGSGPPASTERSSVDQREIP